MNIWKFLCARMTGYGEQTAIVYGKKSLSYNDVLNSVANPLGRHLPHAMQVIADENILEQALKILWALACQQTAVPVNPGYGEAYCGRVRDYVSENKNKNYPDTAFVLFTSGSTGVPKGVMLSHENVISNILAISDYFHVEQGDRLLIARPLMHAAVLVGEFLFGLYKGAEIHLYPEAFQPLRVLNYCVSNKITTLCGTPTLWNMLCKFAGRSGSPAFRNIAISGECLPIGTVNQIDKVFPGAYKYSVYGLTEASPRVSYLPPELFAQKKGSIGVPITNVEMRIVDECGEVLQHNESGRLQVRSPGIMQGYLGDEGQTKGKIVDGWLDTGDVAYRDADGYYYIICRADDMIIRSGMNIYPGEIESMLAKDPRIENVTCYAVDDISVGKLICADVVCALTDKEVRKIAMARLPDYMQPNKIRVFKELQYGAGGKVIKGI